MAKHTDLEHDYRILTIVHWMMVIAAGAMLWVLIPMLSGQRDELATPVGVAGLVITAASVLYAGKKLKDKADGGVRLAYWGRAIRTMSTINIIVALVMIAIPRLPL